jgi:hypothetical protein
VQSTHSLMSRPSESQSPTLHNGAKYQEITEVVLCF